MPNTNAPFGFRPSRHVTGTGHRLNKHKIPSGLAETFTIGDLMKSDGTGGIKKAAAGDAILGTFAGWQYDTQGLSSSSYAGSSNGQIPFFKTWVSGQTVPTGVTVVAWVHDDPFETFEVQTTSTVAEVDIGALIDLVDGTPNQIFGASRQSVGAPGGGASQFRIEKIVQKQVRIADANNNTTGWGLSGPGQYAILEVKCAKHERGGAAMAVAV